MKSRVKRVRRRRRRGRRDRISGLPDELLVHILSFLPATCAVSTSALSKRWRYVFTLTDSLCFDDSPCFVGSEGNKDTKAARTQWFKKFVYNVLKMHQVSPIKKFSLVCQGNYDSSDLSAWVGEAVQKDVKEIHYEVPQQRYTLPDALIRCETLVKLEIVSSGNNVLRIHGPACLPNLKILHMESVEIYDYDSVMKLFSSCKLLVDLSLKSFHYKDCHVTISMGLLKSLTIEDCTFFDGLLEIDAPNLAYLTYGSNTGVKVIPSWKNSGSLVNAELKFDHCHIDWYFWRNSLPHDRHLLKTAAYKVTQLHLLSDSIESLLVLPDHEEIPDFPILSSLRLDLCPYDAWQYLTRLLDKSPLLETIIFEKGLIHWFYNPLTCPPVPLPPFSSQVKVIILRRFFTNEGVRVTLKHLLRNARVLKRLIVQTHSSDDLEEELLISKDLLMLPRASADCCIELNSDTPLSNALPKSRFSYMD